MLETEARAKLVDMVAATVFPILPDATLDRLVNEARRVDEDGRLPSEDVEWTPATIYALDNIVVPVSRSGRAYRVTDAGTSGTTEPVWPTTTGGVVTLDGVEYTEDSTGYIWQPTYDLNRAASDGWRIKAGMVSNRHDFGSNQGNYNPSQVYEHCMKMADYYGSKVIASIRLKSGRWDRRGGLPGAHLHDSI